MIDAGHGEAGTRGFSRSSTHVTERGNGRAQTFFEDEDYALYRDLLGRHCAAAGVEIWAWVLMPNHVHLVLHRPTLTASAAHWRWFTGAMRGTSTPGSGGLAISGRSGSGAWQWTRRISQPHCAMSCSIRSVRAFGAGGEWRWSSAAAHIVGQDCDFVTAGPALERVGDFAAFWASRGRGADLCRSAQGRERGPAGRIEAVARR